VNCEGRWQSFAGVANPVGAARPGWKVLRVLGSLLQAEDFDYQSSEEVRDELLEALGSIELDNTYHGNSVLVNAGSNGSGSLDLDIPMYQIDGLVRHATALQLTPEALRATEDAE
jgi:NADH-quinone oxidoreductase subunit G